MSSFVIDTSNVSLGQVIRTNITDQGIFRVFYNDISGNMYCALNRESNYKQVIYKSAENRTVWADDVSMNSPLYGGTYNLNELQNPSQGDRYYIFKYPTITSATNIGACDRGPISYFTDPEPQRYIKQGSSSGEMYGTQGMWSYGAFSKFISWNGADITTAQAGREPYAFGVGFGYCTSERGGYALDPSMAAIIARANGLSLGGNGVPFVDSSGAKGLYAYNSGASDGMAFYGEGSTVTGDLAPKKGNTTEGYRPSIPASTTFAMYFPDVQNMADPSGIPSNVQGITNKVLNTNYVMNSMQSNTVGGRFITEPWQTDISNNLSSGPSCFNAKYYMASKRPKYVYYDNNNHSINPYNGTFYDTILTDGYYKGRWTIYVDVANRVRDPTNPDNFIDNDTSGNIYLSGSNRAKRPVSTHLLFSHFTNSSTTNEIKNVYVDLDLDISKNASSPSYNNIFAQPYFIVGSDVSNNVYVGTSKYDYLGNGPWTHCMLLTDGTNTFSGSMYHKIKIDPTSQDWHTTRWHAVCYVNGSSSGGGTSSGNCLRYITGKSNGYDVTDEPLTFTSDCSYNLQELIYPGNNSLAECGQGFFVSLDMSGNLPCIAYFTGNQNLTGNKFEKRSIYLFCAKSNKIWDNSLTDTQRRKEWGEGILIEENAVSLIVDGKNWNTGDWYQTPNGQMTYQDLSNNQPINLKISPRDGTAHICYQKQDKNGNVELKYWTNSTDLRDISGVDSSLNYLGLQTQGKTIDVSAASVEAYWDLSSAKCLFSRDYTRYDENNNIIGFLPSSTNNQWQIKRYTKPYGGRDGDFSNTLVYDNPIIYKALYFDKIYMITRVKTPSSWGTYEDLFALGSQPSASNGAYFAGAYSGSPFFGVQSNYQSSNIIATTTTGPPGFGAHCYKNGASTPITSNFILSTNRIYELEYYYSKPNSYAFIKVTDLSGQTAPTTDTYEFYDISKNGGFNMKDGYLSIGSGAHSNSLTEFWTGEIYKMSIYGTDISNIPQFTVTRNGEILDTSGNKYSSFFDNSGNEGLDIEPKINNYQVIDVSNSLNGITCPADISGSSYVKSAFLHDIYYYQLIPNQTGIATGGQKVVAFDKFEDGTGIWACGWVKDTGGSGKQIPTVWVSNDNGVTWNTKDTPSSLYAGNYYTDTEYFWVIKTYTDISGGKWVFVGGQCSLLYASNTYGANGQVGGKTLGNEWRIIGTMPDPSGNGNPAGEYFDRSSSSTPDSGWVPQDGASFFPGWMTICPVDINLTESKAIFNGQDASSNAFHLWLGHFGTGSSFIKDMLIRGNHVDYSNNTLDYSKNIVANTILNENTFDPSGVPWTNESMLSFSFGGVDKGVGSGTIEEKIMDNSGGLSYGIATTDNYVYTTKNGGKTWDKKLATDRKKIGGNSTPNRWVTGTTGSYVEKNKIYDTLSGTHVYDNSGMYIQTQAEPWISLPGFMVADNIDDKGFGNYDLSFYPTNNTDPKTITWDPSLNSNDYWNPLVLDNSGRGINWKIGGGNNYKVYIDNDTSDFGSNPGNKEYKEETWTWDTFQPSTYNYDYWGLSNQGSVLYQKGSEYSQQWKKIEFSPFDISINELTTNQKFHWESMSPVDLSYSIIHNDVWATSSTSSGVENVSVVPNTYGFFKLSKVPPIPSFVVNYDNVSTQADLTLYYKGLAWILFKERIGLEKLKITTKWYRRKITSPPSPAEQIGQFTPATAEYSLLAPNLSRGSSYEFFVILNNKYGDSWSSSVSDPINIPSPDPSISNLSIQTKLFENKLQWKPFIQTDPVTGQSIQSVYAYDISKQYFDISNSGVSMWKDDLQFYNAFKDMSGSIVFAQWNGSNGLTEVEIDPPTNMVTNVTLVDTDISLNIMYRYGIIPKRVVGAITQIPTFWINTRIDNGMPSNIKYDYSVNDASFNICWNKYQDISTNTTVTWDISWQEIQKDGTTDNSGIYVYDDPSGVSNYGTGKNFTRIIGLPLTPSHLLADASYNFQIKGHYKNNSTNTEFDTSYNLLYDTNGNKTLPYTYWNQQQIPVLNDIIYNTSNDIIDINWNATTIPDTPYYYDISLSNITANRTDYSYNIIVNNGNKLPDISNNGLLYYPGEYNVRVKAAYGNSVPTVTSLFSEWSNPKSFSVPTHLPTNFKVTPYNSNDIEDITDVSYVKLTWDAPGKNISNNIFGYPPHDLSFSLIRKTANKTYNYVIDYSNNNIDKTLDSFIDNNYPLGQNPTVPRLYRYDLSANYL